MGNIFDVQPPDWLTAIAKPIDTKLTGHVLGTALAGATNALRRDPNAPADASWSDSRVGWDTGLTEARLNQADPTWPLKVRSMQMQQLSQAVQIKSTLELLDLKEQEQRAWINDVGLLKQKLALPPDQQMNLNWAEGLTSKQGLQMAQQFSRMSSQSAVAKQLNESAVQYNRRLAVVLKNDASAGAGLALQPGQFPTADQFARLEAAEARAQAKVEANKPAQSPGGKITADLDREIAGANRPEVIEQRKAELEKAKTVGYQTKEERLMNYADKLAAAGHGDLAKGIRDVALHHFGHDAEASARQKLRANINSQIVRAKADFAKAVGIKDKTAQAGFKAKIESLQGSYDLLNDTLMTGPAPTNTPPAATPAAPATDFDAYQQWKRGQQP